MDLPISLKPVGGIPLHLGHEKGLLLSEPALKFCITCGYSVYYLMSTIPPRYSRWRQMHLNTFFAEIGQRLASKITAPSNIDHIAEQYEYNNHEFEFQDITLHGLRKEVSQIQIFKSLGIPGVATRIRKEVLENEMIFIFNLS